MDYFFSGGQRNFAAPPKNLALVGGDALSSHLAFNFRDQVVIEIEVLDLSTLLQGWDSQDCLGAALTLLICDFWSHSIYFLFQLYPLSCARASSVKL